MNRFLALLVGLTFLSAIALVAADEATWNKPLPEWTPADAQTVLTGSPWVKVITVATMRKLSESERREGGNMQAEGGGKGIGVEGLGNLSLFGGKTKPPVKAPPAPKVWIRWESALPVRAAELRAADNAAPEIDGEDYAICVYNVPLELSPFERKSLPENLKRVTALKLDGGKEIRPSKVLVRDDGSTRATLVYFFPRSLNINAGVKRVDFTAQVGRLFLSQFFSPEEMQFQSKLAL
jgi:hypothetical protein